MHDWSVSIAVLKIKLLISIIQSTHWLSKFAGKGLCCSTKDCLNLHLIEPITA